MAEAATVTTTQLSARHLPAMTLADLNTTINHEPRVRDLDLAERLGMADPHDIRRKIIETNRAELEAYGGVSGRRPETSAKGGRPATEYWLNEPQALLVCMFSRTERAADVRRALIEVFTAWRRQQVAPPVGTQPALPLPGRNGYGIVMIDGEPVAFDANCYEIRHGAKAVVLNEVTGAISVMPVERDIDSRDAAPRAGFAGLSRVEGGCSVRDGVRVLGRVVYRRKPRMNPIPA